MCCVLNSLSCWWCACVKMYAPHPSTTCANMYIKFSGGFIFIFYEHNKLSFIHPQSWETMAGNVAPFLSFSVWLKSVNTLECINEFSSSIWRRAYKTSNLFFYAQQTKRVISGLTQEGQMLQWLAQNSLVNIFTLLLSYKMDPGHSWTRINMQSWMNAQTFTEIRNTHLKMI